MVVKYDGANGGVLWTATETGLVNDQTGDGWVAVDGAGDVVVSWKSWGGATSYDVGVAKYDGDDGSGLWQIAYNFDGASADDPSDMILDDAGDVFVVGSSAGDFLTLKLDGDDGAVHWARTYEGPQGWVRRGQRRDPRPRRQRAGHRFQRRHRHHVGRGDGFRTPPPTASSSGWSVGMVTTAPPTRPRP